MTNQKTEKISEIFNELKTKGIIDPRRILELSTLVRSFKASTLKSTNKIYYNPSMVGLDDDSIMFCLLHEEGHFINPQYAFYFFPLGIVVFVVAIFLITLDSFQIDILYKLSLGVFLIFIPLFSYIIPSRFDEFQSDEFAALLIKKQYPQKNTSEILKQALDFINTEGSPFLDFHPSSANRVKNIQDSIENK
jgi:Zn-dependent protease with chaperone function